MTPQQIAECIQAVLVDMGKGETQTEQHLLLCFVQELYTQLNRKQQSKVFDDELKKLAEQLKRRP